MWARIRHDQALVRSAGPDLPARSASLPASRPGFGAVARCGRSTWADPRTEEVDRCGPGAALGNQTLSRGSDTETPRSRGAAPTHFPSLLASAVRRSADVELTATLPRIKHRDASTLHEHWTPRLEPRFHETGGR